VLHRVECDVAKDWSLPVGTNDAARRVDPTARQRDEGLTGQVPNGLARVCPTDDEETDVGVREEIADDALDPEVLGLERAHDRHVRISIASDRGREPVVRERADRDRCLIPKHRVGARQGRPAGPRLDGLRRTRGMRFTAAVMDCVHSEGREADIAAEAVIPRGRELCPCRGDCGHERRWTLGSGQHVFDRLERPVEAAAGPALLGSGGLMESRGGVFERERPVD
jgi:hypothetical protein